MNKESPHLIRQVDVIIHRGVHFPVASLAEELLRCRIETALITTIILNEVMIEFASSFINQSVSIVLFSLMRQHIFPKARATPLSLGLSLLPPCSLDFLVEPRDKWPRANHLRTQWCMPVKSLSQGHVIAVNKFIKRIRGALT